MLSGRSGPAKPPIRVIVASALSFAAAGALSLAVAGSTMALADTPSVTPATVQHTVQQEQQQLDQQGGAPDASTPVDSASPENTPTDRKTPTENTSAQPQQTTVQPETSGQPSGGTQATAPPGASKAPAEGTAPPGTSAPGTSPAGTNPAGTPPAGAGPPKLAEPQLEHFLDRLMMAESGGVVNARNPRSTAVGPFQFIESTFYEVLAKHFAAETASLSSTARLSLRFDRAFSRRAAEAYTRENATYLASRGLETSFRNLRLAFLAGPNGAARILRAKPDDKVAGILGAGAVSANPFLARMSVASLLDKCARDIDGQTGALASVQSKGTGRPRVNVACNLALPSCRKWLALATDRLDGKVSGPQRKSQRKRSS